MQITTNNKKRLILFFRRVSHFFLIMLFSANISAQHYVGVKGSQGFSSVAALPKFDKHSLPAFSPGILYRYEHQKYAALQIEANYINKGYIKDIDTISMTPEITNRIASLEIPLMAQGFVRLGPFRPYLTGGAVFGYILDRSTQIKGENSEKYVFDEYDRRFEYGITGGGGLGIKISRFEIQAECRYHYSFSFLRNPIIPEKSNTYFNSTQLMFSVSLLYRLTE
jgi:hypothetical protein